MNYENEIIAIYGACKTIEELKKAYISLIRKFHPDKGGSVERNRGEPSENPHIAFSR